MNLIAKPVRLARAGHPSAPQHAAIDFEARENGEQETQVAQNESVASPTVPLPHHNTCQEVPARQNPVPTDQCDSDELLGGHIDDPIEENDPTWVSTDPFASQGSSSGTQETVGLDSTCHGTTHVIPIDPSLLDHPQPASPRQSTPVPQAITATTSHDEGAPNSPIAHAFARMRQVDPMAQPPTGMAPVPLGLLSLQDLDYCLNVPKDGTEHHLSRGNKENSGGKRKRAGDDTGAVEPARRKSNRLSGGDRAVGSKSTAPSKPKAQRKSTKGTYFGIGLNEWGTGIINVVTGEPVDPATLPKAEVLALLPDYVF